MEKLNTIIDIKPVMIALKMVKAVSPLSTTSPGRLSSKYLDTP